MLRLEGSVNYLMTIYRVWYYDLCFDGVEVKPQLWQMMCAARGLTRALLIKNTRILRILRSQQND